jgi:hypothetical protein
MKHPVFLFLLSLFFIRLIDVNSLTLTNFDKLVELEQRYSSEFYSTTNVKLKLDNLYQL